MSIKIANSLQNTNLKSLNIQNSIVESCKRLIGGKTESKFIFPQRQKPTKQTLFVVQILNICSYILSSTLVFHIFLFTISTFVYFYPQLKNVENVENYPYRSL